jgi:RNA polymerase sigma-70 factor, ECF subfamily
MTETDGEDLRRGIVERLPNLRAFARSITNDPLRADDLVHDTIVKALAHLDSFEVGTNLTAWLFTILRNHYYTEVRKRHREIEDSDGVHAARLVSQPRQMDTLAVNDVRAALATLPAEQREALVLVAGAGVSYEEAAEICGCAVGTIKSRVNRARARLTELLDPDAGQPGKATPKVAPPVTSGKRIAGANN